MPGSGSSRFSSNWICETDRLSAPGFPIACRRDALPAAERPGKGILIGKAQLLGNLRQAQVTPQQLAGHGLQYAVAQRLEGQPVLGQAPVQVPAAAVQLLRSAERRVG